MDRRQSAFIRLIAWSIAAVALVIILLLGITGRFHWFNFGFNGFNSGYYYTDTDKYQAGDGEIEGDKVRDLEINWISGDIKVEVYDGDTVQFFEKSSKELNENEQLHYYNKNGRLIIQFQKAQKKMLSMGKGLNKELTVKIPESTAKAMGYFCVDTVSSETRIKGIHVNKMNLNSTSGGFEIDKCSSVKLTIDSTSGSITANSLVVEEKLELNTTSGSASLEGSFQSVSSDTVSGSIDIISDICPEKVRTDSVSGSVTLAIPENNGFTYRKDTVSGSLKCDFAVSQEDDKGIYKDGDAVFDFESVSGSITIKELGNEF